MPADLRQLAEYMRQSYTESSQWWQDLGTPVQQQDRLPEALLDDDHVHDGGQGGSLP